MRTKINILHLECLQTNTELIDIVLIKQGFKVNSLAVDTKEKFRNALHQFNPDVILAEHSLPSFNAYKALECLHESGLQIPFILITADPSDEFATDIVNKGADDYVMKDRPGRLPVAVRNALDKFRLQKEKLSYTRNLREEEQRYKALIENGTEGVLIFNLQFLTIYCSPSVQRVLGYDEGKGLGLNLLTIVHPDDIKGVEAVFADCMQQPSVPLSCNICRVQHENGSWVWLEATLTNMLEHPSINGIVTNFRDVSERRLSEEKLVISNRMYSFLSEVNRMLVYARNKQTLFDEVCRIAVELGLFKMAWIGYADLSKRTIRLQAGCGTSASDKRLLSNYLYAEDGPIANVLNGNEHFVVQDIENEISVTWKQYVTEKNFRSAITLPIKQSGKTIGTFTLYSSEVNFFPPEQISLLQETAATISFALDVLEKDALRTEVESQLKQSEFQFRHLIEDLPVAMYTTNEQCQLQISNKSAVELWGRNPDAGEKLWCGTWMLKKNGFWDVPSNHGQKAVPQIEKGAVCHTEFVITRPDGSKRNVTPFSTPRWDNRGKTIGGINMLIDITERKKVEAALLDLQLNMQAIFENSSDGFLLVDSKGIIKVCNKKAIQLLRLEEQAGIIEGGSIFEYVDPSIASNLKETIGKLSSRSTIQYDYAFTTKTAKADWININVSTIDNGSGIEGYCITSSDITPRKIVEEALTHSELRYRQIVETMQEGIWTVDQDNCTSFVNEKTCMILGYTPDQMSGKDLFSFIHQEGSGIAKVITENKKQLPAGSFEVNFISCDGRLVWILVNTNPIFGNNNEYKGGLAMITDITAKKLTDNILKESECSYRLLAAKSTREHQRLLEAQAVAKIGSWEIEFPQFSFTWSPELYRIFEVDPDHYIPSNQGMLDFVHPGDLGLVQETFQASIQHHQPTSMVYRIILNNGISKVVNLSWKITGGNHGVPLRAIGTCQDITAQKHAEEKLRESESRYRSIVETAQEGIWLIDENNKTTFVNNKLSEIFEYPREEMLGKEIYYFMDQEGRAHAELLMEDKKKGKIGSLEFRYISKTGKTIWTNVSANPIFNEAGLYQGSLAMIMDKTEKKKLESLLDQANHMAMIGSFEVNLVTNKIYWSAITKEIHEVPQDYSPDLESMNKFYKVYSSHDALQALIREQIATGSSDMLELQILTAKDNLKWVSIHFKLEFQDGKWIKLSGSIQDIDARKRAETEMLKVLEEKIDILESIQDGFYALDKDFNVTYFNKQSELLLRKKREEVLGKNLWESFPDAVNTMFYTFYQTAMKENKTQHFEGFYESTNLWSEVNVYPSANGLAIYFRDITERKIYENQLKKLNQDLLDHSRELAISNRELEQFAYVASHDLQEPLRMITSFLLQLEKKYGNILDEKAKRYINFAVDGARRMKEVILDLLEYSTIGKNIENDKGDINLNEILKDIISLNRKLLSDTRAVIKFSKLPTITNFRTPVYQLLENLISNALKYTTAGRDPVIEVGATLHEGVWQFSVSDNGIGIEAEYYEKIFIMFQRLHHKDEFAGTGIGLAICKKIADHLGGKIWVESEYGQGSCFYFTIPVHNIQPEKNLVLMQ